MTYYHSLLVLMTAALNKISGTSEVALLHMWLLNYAATAIAFTGRN
jgi:hypothetical protein